MAPTLQQTTPGITFAVDDVTPTDKVLTECKLHEQVRRLVEADVESCSDYHGYVLSHSNYHPLLAAVYTAYSEHRPLVLTPDAVWLTIAQGVAHHMAIHGERLRSRFVSHQGKLDLVFKVTDWVKGTPENPWADAFEAWAGLIRDHVGPDAYPVLACDFSTSGPVERAAGHVVMMDVFQRYFHYVLACVCGIPTVTLEGTPGDWERLREKAAALRVFDMDWWLDKLLPVCDQFARAARGDVDLPHWQRICKIREEYGGDIINGWVATLFPYVREFYNGPCRLVNPVFEGGDGITTFNAPSGLSRVPFTWRNGTDDPARPMEAIAGLVGVTQDPRTLALRPKAGWAVRDADPFDVLLSRLGAGHATRPGAVMPDPARFGRSASDDFPAGLLKFYHHSDGAELFPGRPSSVRVLPMAEVTPLEWGERKCSMSKGPGGATWHRLAVLPDGSFLAINLDGNRERPQSVDYSADFNPICHCRPDTAGLPGQNPVVALTFRELLERVLAGGPSDRWLEEAASKGYGDAEQYTRRNESMEDELKQPPTRRGRRGRRRR